MVTVGMSRITGIRSQNRKVLDRFDLLLRKYLVYDRDMAKKTIIQLVRYLLEHGGMSRYRISKETGISEGRLCRILHGQSCTVETAEKILDLFGYELTKRKD
jgi:hypothetical protein